MLDAKPGDHVIYVDAHGDRHDALIYIVMPETVYREQQIGLMYITRQGRDIRVYPVYHKDIYKKMGRDRYWHYVGDIAYPEG